MPWKLLAALAVGFGVAIAAGGASSKPKQPPPEGNVKGRAAVEAAARNLGLPEPWVLWCIWVAKGESGWSTNAWLGRPKDDGTFSQAAAVERKASLDTMTRLISEGRWPCANDPSKYGIGSGGWFGQLAALTAYFSNKLGLPDACEPMAIWHDPARSMRSHLEQVRGTLKILRSKTSGHGTFMELRALYGLPKRDPDDPTDPFDSHNIDTPERRAQYSKTLKSAGIDPSFLDQEVPPFPTLA